MGLIEKLANLRLPIVIGEGPKGADLLLLGEALGATEVEKGRPFCGEAGWLLDDVLRCAGVHRENCHVMNVIPTRPPDNKVSRLSELGISLEECIEWCRGRIRELRPKVVLALGATALQCMAGYVDITDWRGSVLESELGGGITVKVIPTFHPSYVKRMADKTARKEREATGSVKYTYGSARLSMVIDSKRALGETKVPGLNRLSRRLIVSPSLEQVREYLSESLEAPKASFDVETMGKWIDCVGVSHSPMSAICIPRGNLYWKDDCEKVENLLRDFFWTHDGLVAQNASFDMIMLMGNGIPVRKLHMDTQVAHHFMYPELPHDLHYLTSIYTREPYYKWRLRAAKSLEERWVYNCLDSATTIEVAMALVAELCEYGVENEFFGYVMPLFHTVMKMGLRGVRTDQKWQARLQATLTKLIHRQQNLTLKRLGLQGCSCRELGLTLKGKKVLDSELNLFSPTQLKQLLYGIWGLPKQLDRKTKKVTVDDEAIKKLMKVRRPSKCPIEPKLLQGILDVRDVQKKKSTYADVELSFDGRLRTLYSVTGTETGRLSSKQDYFNMGWNSQNPPKWFRRIVIPEEGEVLYEFDLKFAEALITSWMAKDRETIQRVREGIDIYRFHAGRMFKKDWKAVTKEERTVVKPVVLGCGYGLGPIHLAEMIGCSVAKGREYRDLFFQSCPAILDYQAWVREQLQTTRTLITPFNRRRTFLGRMGDELFRKGYAFLPQSTCVEYINRALVRIDLRLGGLAKCLLQVHDAIVLCVRKEAEEDVFRIVIGELAVPVVIQGEPLVIPVEVKRSEKNWREMTEVGVFNNFGRS